jgi:hypothetical protein
MQRTTADNFHAWLRLMLEPHLIRTLPTGAPTNIFKAVLDTTVLVAAMLRPESEGVSAEVLKLAAEGRYEFFLSDDILEETAVTLAASERSQQAFPDLCRAARRAESSSRQGPTEGHRGARPRAFRGSGSCGHGRYPGGEGLSRNQRNNPMQLPLHRALKCRALTRSGESCQAPAMPNGRCRMHGGSSPGAPKGNKNALKHGRYAADAIAWRREISGLVRAMKALI